MDNNIYTLFAAPSWCDPCKELKSWMVAKQIKLPNLRHVDIDVDPVFAKSCHIEKVPTLMVRAKGAIGFQLLEGREEIKPYLEHLNGTYKSSKSDS